MKLFFDHMRWHNVTDLTWRSCWYVMMKVWSNTCLTELDDSIWWCFGHFCQSWCWHIDAQKPHKSNEDYVRYQAGLERWLPRHVHFSRMPCSPSDSPIHIFRSAPGTEWSAPVSNLQPDREVKLSFDMMKLNVLSERWPHHYTKERILSASVCTF